MLQTNLAMHIGREDVVEEAGEVKLVLEPKGVIVSPIP
jgi:hypothetical protein